MCMHKSAQMNAFSYKSAGKEEYAVRMMRDLIHPNKSSLKQSSGDER